MFQANIGSLRFSSETNRQQDIKHHHERQGHQVENGHRSYGDDKENPPNLVAFPFCWFNLEREKPQAANHHEREDERDAEANPIT